MDSLKVLPCRNALVFAVAALAVAGVSAAQPQQTAVQSAQTAAPAQTQNVNVVNTPTVAISGTPTVTVGNSVAVKEAPITPVHEWVAISFAQNQDQSPSNVYTVPAGQRLVIESVTMSCFQQNGAVSSVRFYVNQPNGNVTLAYMTPPPIIWTPGQPYTTGAETHALHAIVDAGSSVTFFATRGSVGDYGNCQGAFSGYLTPLP